VGLEYGQRGNAEHHSFGAHLTTLTLPFPPSVNNLFINRGKKRIRSPGYSAWSDLAGYQINRQKPLPVIGPVKLVYEFQEGQDNRRRDIDNLAKPVNDILVEHGIIEADDNRIVRAMDLRWSREVVGVRITVEAA
jgi:Holliday junction resolvase RusA-like endonuclease